MNITWVLNPYKNSLFQNKRIDISIALLQLPSSANGDFTLWSSHYSPMKYAKHLRKMNFLNSPSVQQVKTKDGSLLGGVAPTLNRSYLPVQICSSDTCHVLERIEEEAAETRGSDLGP